MLEACRATSARVRALQRGEPDDVTTPRAPSAVATDP